VSRLNPLDPLFACALLGRRRALGWSQNRLALAAGLTESYLQKVETLRQGATPEARIAIEAALAQGEARSGATPVGDSGCAR